jgi:type I restriction enzyme M protein
MANIQQREELHKTIWKMADDLRGQAGGWEFKAYVLGGVEGFDYADMSDEEAEIVKELGE